ncbi:MAG: flagellar hook-associated protein FlgL [Phycisphaerae bacterium]
MALSPLNITRVSFTQQTGTLLESLRRKSMEILTQQARLSTGKAVNAPSEDPGKAAQVLDMQGALVKQSQVSENLRHATSFLDATESAILDISTLLSDAHSIASQNAGSLASPEERQAAAELVADIVEQLVTVGNRQFNGTYLFGGRATQQAPFVTVEGGVAYVGDTGDMLARVDLNDQEPINLTGDQLFGSLSSVVTARVDLRPRLTSDTRLEDVTAADGSPITPGLLVIQQVSSGERFTIDLTGADTLGDVVNLINAQAGSIVDAKLEDTGITLTPKSGQITVTDTSSGSTAADLGLLTDPQTGDPVGGTLSRRLSRTTRVEDLAGGLGVDLTGGLLINSGTQAVAVDVSQAQSVQDILNAINNSGLPVEARISADGSGIDVFNQVSGQTLGIAENGGTTAAALGLRTMDADTLLSALNFGQGVETVAGKDDLRVTAKDGSTVDVNLDDALTLGDVIAAINTAATDAGVGITASLAGTGNGISIQDSTGGTGPLSVSRLNLSFAADDLGLTELTVDGQATDLISRDVSATRTDSALTALLDLERALRNDDGQAITEAGQRVFEFIGEVARVQGVVGARSRAMQNRQAQTDAAVFATERLVSELTDLDFAEAVTQFQLAQTSLQATLLAGSQSFNLSLLNFLQ